MKVIEYIQKNMQKQLQICESNSLNKLIKKICILQLHLVSTTAVLKDQGIIHLFRDAGATPRQNTE